MLTKKLVSISNGSIIYIPPSLVESTALKYQEKGISSDRISVFDPTEESTKDRSRN